MLISLHPWTPKSHEQREQPSLDLNSVLPFSDAGLFPQGLRALPALPLGFLLSPHIQSPGRFQGSSPPSCHFNSHTVSRHVARWSPRSLSLGERCLIACVVNATAAPFQIASVVFVFPLRSSSRLGPGAGSASQPRPGWWSVPGVPTQSALHAEMADSHLSDDVVISTQKRSPPPL